MVLNIISAVSDDDFCGIFIKNTLRGCGVNTYLQKFYGVGSTKDVIIVFRGEDRRLYVYISSTSLLIPVTVKSQTAVPTNTIFNIAITKQKIFTSH